jgi:toxin ParE1/3/4
VSPAVLAPAAREDLRRAVSHIIRDNPAAARRLRDAVALALRRLGANPTIGTVRPALAADRYRFLAVGRFPYLLVYTADTAPPRVLRMLHMARDIAAVLANPD